MNQLLDPLEPSGNILMVSEISLFNADCLEIMENVIPDNSIDLTITSPPYDNLREYNGMTPFIFDVFKPIADSLFKITKNGGVVVWNVNDATINGSETGTSFKQALYFKEIGFNLHDTMIFAKKNPMPLNHNRYDPAFEYMFILTKGKLSIFNPLSIPCITANTIVTSGKYTATEKENSAKRNSLRKPTLLTKYRSNIWFYGVGSGRENFHPASFPLQLVIDHILSWSNEQCVVLDPFLGSGTTGIACKNLNRNFIGIEKDETYFKIAEKRITEA